MRDTAAIPRVVDAAVFEHRHEANSVKFGQGFYPGKFKESGKEIEA